MPDRRAALELIDAQAVGRSMLERMDQAYRGGALSPRCTDNPGGREDAAPPQRHKAQSSD